MKPFYTMNWNKPAPYHHTVYIVNIIAFAHKREPKLYPGYMEDIFNIRSLRSGANKQSDTLSGTVGKIPC